MSTESAEDYDISLHGDDVYDTPLDMMKNASYSSSDQFGVVDNKIATSVRASSYNGTKKSKKEDPPITKKCGTLLSCLMTLIIIVLIIVVGVTLFASKLRSDAVLQSTLSGTETTLANVTTLVIQAIERIMEARFSEVNDQLNSVTTLVLDATANLTRRNNEVNNRNICDSLSISLSFLISKTTAGNTNSLEAFLVGILNETGNAFASCAVIHQCSPSSPSGYYHIRSSNGSAVRVYCDMTRSCGNITGGWMRVDELDMRDNTTHCPSSLELLTSPRRTCRIRSSGAALCSSDTFTVDGVEYSKVCGRVRAYQVASPNGFRFSSIESYYVDGVSLTHGRSPRQHIWTFAAATNEDARMPYHHKCRCINTAISSLVPPPPSFVGEDYFCDTAAITGEAPTFYADDPLWDGAGCGPQNTCCSFNTPPWFYKQLPLATTDDIEMRVCRNHVRDMEDIAIEVVEIYVQ